MARASEPRRQRGLAANRQLRDHHGEWCGWCYEYFDTTARLEEHHVLPEARVRRMFDGLHLDFRWLIPVHASDWRGRDDGRQRITCHGLMQGHAERAFEFLAETLAGARTLEVRSGLSAWFHDRGYYWLAVLVNLHTLYDPHYQLDAATRTERKRYLLSSGAGIRGCQNLPLVAALSAEDLASIPLLFHRANHAVTRGDLRRGREILKHADALVASVSSAERDSLRGQQLLRKAQVTEQPDCAVSAWSVTTGHSQSTALVLQGLTAAGIGNCELLESAIGLLLGRWKEIGWLYRAQVWYMQALLLIITGRGEKVVIYDLLTRAQFVYVLLGLQLSVSPSVNLEPPAAVRKRSWTPGAALQASVQGIACTGDLADRALLTARRRTMLEPLYKAVFEPLMGVGTDVPERGALYKQRIGDVVNGCLQNFQEDS